ncbi:atl1 [Candida pseudojiufengensis]|uniref:atl1 n=1 Tax=Candida pseudojiufengensis TaxID=497109 RepID=UPI002225B32D|nr:atl1 [Candida pseudojiufengensis]KAI5961919.1 atl1 [Candida pseudojiufengensis]
MVKLTDESRAFHYGVYSIVFKIPPGKVTSYDKPQNSRQVGSSLKHCSMIFQDLNQGFDPREEEYLNIENLPWWRVLASSGKISERGNSRSQYEQADRLRNEHVNVSDNHFVDLDEFGWFPDYVDLS